MTNLVSELEMRRRDLFSLYMFYIDFDNYDPEKEDKVMLAAVRASFSKKVEEKLGTTLKRHFISSKDDLYLPLIQNYLEKFEVIFKLYEIAVYSLFAFSLEEIRYTETSYNCVSGYEERAYKELLGKMKVFFSSNKSLEIKKLKAFHNSLREYMEGVIKIK